MMRACDSCLFVPGSHLLPCVPVSPRSQATGKDVDVPFNFLAAKYHEFYETKLKEVEDSID